MSITERKAQDAEAMAAQLKKQKETRLTKSQYNEISAELKRESLRTDIDGQMSILEAVYSRGKVDLYKVEEVKAQTMAYMQACSEAAQPPLFMQLCAALGHSRQNVYSFIANHRGTESADFLENVRQSFTAVMASQALQRNFSETVSIFLMKNSGNGLQDKVEIEAVQNNPVPTYTLDELSDKVRLLPGAEDE